MPQGYKDSPLGIIPQEWEVKRMQKIVKYQSGYAFNSTDSCEKGIKWLKIANVGVKQAKWEELNFLPYEFRDIFSEFLLKADDIVLALTRPILDKKLKITKLTKNDVPALLNQRVAKVIPINENDANFIYQAMQHPRFIHDMLSDILGTDPPNASFDCMYKQKIPLPPLPEQQKIAEMLTYWDAAIEKQTQLIDKLETRNRGLMQQLLTGKKRLKGFAREWQKTKLSELGNTYVGLTGKNKDDFGEGKPYVSYLNIFKNSKIDTSNFEYVKIGNDENQNKAAYGDIFFTVSSETSNEVGMSSVLLDNVDELYLNSFCFGFRLFSFEILEPLFARYFFRSASFRKEIYKLSQGATRYNLSKNEVLKIAITLPSIPEQTAIANILSAADEEIEKEKEKLTVLKLQKKGLMQVLLTGKKRVKI